MRDVRHIVTVREGRLVVGEAEVGRRELEDGGSAAGGGPLYAWLEVVEGSLPLDSYREAAPRSVAVSVSSLIENVVLPL